MPECKLVLCMDKCARAHIFLQLYSRDNSAHQTVHQTKYVISQLY